MSQATWRFPYFKIVAPRFYRNPPYVSAHIMASRWSLLIGDKTNGVHLAFRWGSCWHTLWRARLSMPEEGKGE